MAPTTKAKKSADPHKKTATKDTAKHAKKASKSATSAKATKAVKPHAAKATHKHPAPHHKRTLVTKQAKKKTSHKEEVSYGMNEEQKIDLLHLIDGVIQNRKHKPDGLRSFFMIDRILDHFNQKYTDPESKFNAIVKYGKDKHDGIHSEHIYVFTHGRGKDETDLFQLLSEINAEKIKFSEVKKRLEQLIEDNKAQK